MDQIISHTNRRITYKVAVNLRYLSAKNNIEDQNGKPIAYEKSVKEVSLLGTNKNTGENRTFMIINNKVLHRRN